MWYSIKNTEQPFIFEIEGQVQDIERNNLTTEVLVQEDPNGGEDTIVGYQLDDNLVRFSPWPHTGFLAYGSLISCSFISASICKNRPASI